MGVLSRYENEMCQRDVEWKLGMIDQLFTRVTPVTVICHNVTPRILRKSWNTPIPINPSLDKSQFLPKITREHLLTYKLCEPRSPNLRRRGVLKVFVPAVCPPEQILE